MKLSLSLKIASKAILFAIKKRDFISAWKLFIDIGKNSSIIRGIDKLLKD